MLKHGFLLFEIAKNILSKKTINLTHPIVISDNRSYFIRRNN
ncbi:hypothetical protein ACI8B_210039 [Acinetobacter proteolyticus]|uniref:Uncharacterized protein n=1 Tax=Acinetobacter proteolyticus TaxID=1776741 RepID=A0A653K3C8_9GAMM|nr:hypothetical protein ACI8B_210039 [Acinetobacter proteolyticus]